MPTPVPPTTVMDLLPTPMPTTPMTPTTAMDLLPTPMPPTKVMDLPPTTTTTTMMAHQHTKMHQMCPKCVQNVSKMHPKCAQNASKNVHFCAHEKNVRFTRFLLHKSASFWVIFWTFLKVCFLRVFRAKMVIL